MELLFGDVICLRRIDVGRTIGVAADTGKIGAGGGGAGGNWVAIETGKNVDVLRSDVVDGFGDNGLRWYKWRFNVCVGFAGIKIVWCAVAPVGISGIDDVAADGRKVLLKFPIDLGERVEKKIVL